MCEPNKMIQTNDEPTARTPSQNGVREEGDFSRRNSASSIFSSSTTSPNYDSGNISDLPIRFRPASLSSAEDDSISNDYGHHDKFQHLLHEKDQSLFLALQDVRKLKSELERLSKSEKWYRSELRSQKNTRMEILEKLYTNERKFTQENQRLQNECIALYARCSELENQLQEEKELASNLLTSTLKAEAAFLEGEDFSRDFELEQHRQRLTDQEQLIDMLRSQKRSLLNDLQKLSCEKDEVVLHMQSNIARLVDENQLLTKKCLQLFESKNVLTDELLAKETDCASMSNKVLDLELIVKRLEKKLELYITDLNQKEHEVDSLKYEISQKVQSDDIVGLMQKKHQFELSEKQESICSLHNIISTLQTEIRLLEDLRTRYNAQQLEIHQMKNLLEKRTSEVEQLKKDDKIISNQMKDHQLNTEHFQKTSTSMTHFDNNDSLRRQSLILNSDLAPTSQSLEQDNLRKTELEQLSEKYLEVCKLYEKSKFDLDMKDITVERFKFEKEKDTREIKTLRERVVEVLKQFECQRSLATEFELTMSSIQQDKRRIESENKCNIVENMKLNAQVKQNVKTSNDKDTEIKNLRTQLADLEDILNRHNAKMNSKEVTTLLFQKDVSEKSVALFQSLIAQKSDKVDQLHAELQIWENLLSDINIEENPLDVESSEFDNLNQLFDEQNLKLMQINKNYRRESISLRKTVENSELENKTFQQDLKTALSANSDYEKEIAHLAVTNERLIQEFNEDFSRERENHKKQTKKLELEVKFRTTESEKLKKEMQLLQAKFDDLNTSYFKSSSRLNENGYQRSEPVKDVLQDRILQNVIETEHQRKMNRYDIHIRSLLSNMKSYKKSLEIAENRYSNLLAKSKEMVEVEELRAMESNLQTMRVQFQCSQSELNNLKHQLKTIREQFSATDASKSSNMMDLTNLMDDYKKLIQQSQTTTKRPSTFDIYSLISKSNNYVPKLTNISTCVDGLREDLQQMFTVMKIPSPAGRGSPQPKMSLMDELQLAESGKLCKN